MSETALLESVRNHIINRCGYDESQCDVELNDDVIPTATGDIYVIVHPAAWKPGECNSPSGTLDEVFNVAVTVIKRSTAVPRDRRRNILIDNLDGLNIQLRKIITALTVANYEINREANSQVSGTGGFMEPLRFVAMGPPQSVGPETLAAKPGTQPAGIKRTVTFGGARRMQTLSASTT